MGNHSSTGNVTEGNINISGNIGNVGVKRSLQQVSVMNCGENPLQIYLHKEKLDASSFTYEQGSVTCFKQDNKIPFKVVPPKSCESFTGSVAFASVFVQCSAKPEVVKATIHVSAAIPPGRSFIVTPNHEIKLQKHGSDNKWLDEDGVDHTPK